MVSRPFQKQAAALIMASRDPRWDENWEQLKSHSKCQEEEQEPRLFGQDYVEASTEAETVPETGRVAHWTLWNVM